MFKRKRLPTELEPSFAAFMAVLAEVEPAKAAITEVMPSTRQPGRPFPDALMEFEEGLGRARLNMPGWRGPQTDEAWERCDAGLMEALDRARGFREEAPEFGGFEGLIWAVERLLAPLEPFVEAAERFRGLRSSRA
ncbi:MAG: hypothetical protein M3P11_07600 [Actinomycetota bacterium]|nr:hypothetical protein [Actinomycetota bacterium]